MTDPHELSKRMRHLTYAWVILSLGFIAGIIMLTLDNIHLRNELAKPVRLTLQQRHEVIKAYLAVGENKLALRQQIGCTDKE